MHRTHSKLKDVDVYIIEFKNEQGDTRMSYLGQCNYTFPQYTFQVRILR